MSSDKIVKFPGVQSYDMPEIIDEEESKKRVDDILEDCKKSNYKKFFLIGVTEETDAMGADLFLRQVNVDEMEMLWMMEQIKYYMFNN
mgnify:CR=1 FL=1